MNGVQGVAGSSRASARLFEDPRGFRETSGGHRRRPELNPAVPTEDKVYSLRVLDALGEFPCFRGPIPSFNTLAAATMTIFDPDDRQPSRVRRLRSRGDEYEGRCVLIKQPNPEPGTNAYRTWGHLSTFAIR